MPRGRAGGFTMSLPQEDKFYASKNEMLEEIVTLLGGRVAEQLTMDDISTGASNDIERATQLARAMVTKYGMSERIGPINYGAGQEEVFLGRDFATSKNFSEEIASEIDAEIRRIITEAYEKCETMLNNHMEVLSNVAEYLIRNETMDGEAFEKLFNGEQVEDHRRGEQTFHLERGAAHTAADAQPEADAQAQTVPSDTDDSDATQKLLDDAVTQVFGAGAQEPRGDAEQTDGDSEQPKE